jgi:hypothetical protein
VNTRRSAQGSGKNAWHRIARYLEIDATGYVQSHYHRWDLWVRDTLSSAELAASPEEWADFFEWQLEVRADELARDRIQRHVVHKWTDEMAYACRRAVAIARGEDPGPWVRLPERRPDLEATGRAIREEITAKLAAGKDRATTRNLAASGAAA